jgi:predicted RNA-binding Zn-ribbon protein involved in translation (DUF1610 family)
MKPGPETRPRRCGRWLWTYRIALWWVAIAGSLVVWDSLTIKLHHGLSTDADAAANVPCAWFVFWVIMSMVPDMGRAGRRRATKTPSDPPPSCHVCGYNLTGNVSGRCPECGTAVGQTDGSRAAMRSDLALERRAPLDARSECAGEGPSSEKADD